MTNKTTVSISHQQPETFDKQGFEALDFIGVGGMESEHHSPVIFVEQGNARKNLILHLQSIGLSEIEAVNKVDMFVKEIRCEPHYIIKTPEVSFTEIITDHSKGRDHGWYHKFNKPNGKRNLKR